MNKPFKTTPIRMGRFRVYYITGDPGDFQIVKVYARTPRAEHKNAPCIISGGGIVVGPQNRWEIGAGQMDMDFPDMPVAGDYRYVAGRHGITMFCSTYLGPYVMSRRKIDQVEPFDIEAGHVGLFISGTADIAGKVTKAPFVVDATQHTKSVVPHGKLLGIELWCN